MKHPKELLSLDPRPCSPYKVMAVMSAAEVSQIRGCSGSMSDNMYKPPPANRFKGRKKSSPFHDLPACNIKGHRRDCEQILDSVRGLVVLLPIALTRIIRHGTANHSADACQGSAAAKQNVKLTGNITALVKCCEVPLPWGDWAPVVTDKDQDSETLCGSLSVF